MGLGLGLDGRCRVMMALTLEDGTVLGWPLGAMEEVSCIIRQDIFIDLYMRVLWHKWRVIRSVGRSRLVMPSLSRGVCSIILEENPRGDQPRWRPNLAEDRLSERMETRV